MHYQFKQDLASAYFPDNSNVAPSESRESLLTMPSLSNVTEGKKTASKRFAHEINLTPGLLDALRPTGNPERELSTAEKINLSEEPPRPKTPLPPANSKSSSPF